jgi:hypothetical protein
MAYPGRVMWATSKPGRLLHQFQLHRVRQTGGDAVRIQLLGVQTLRLDEHLVAVLVGEANHLVFDRRAVARTGTLDLAGVHRRLVQVRADQLVRLLGGPGDVAQALPRVLVAAAKEGEHRTRLVAGLGLEPREVHAAPVHPWRRAGLQAPDREGHLAQALGQPHARRGSPARPPGCCSGPM